MVYIDNLSKITLLIEPMYQWGSLSKASWFVVEENGKSYLITNWHVVSWRNAETGVCLDEKHWSLPDTLKIRFHWKIENTWVYKEVETAQFSLEVNCQFEKNIDVVAIPLEWILTNDIEVYLLDLKLSKTNIRVQCADPVSIIWFLDWKYFQGMYEYPIWKTWHIANR